MSSEQEIISRQAEEIKALRNQVASLKNQLDWLRKKVFGSMSEKRLPEDLKDLEPTLFDDMMTEAEKELLVNDVKKLNEEQDKVISVRVREEGQEADRHKQAGSPSGGCLSGRRKPG